MLQLILWELDHPQPQTPIHVNNTAVIGIVNSKINRINAMGLYISPSFSKIHFRLPSFFEKASTDTLDRTQIVVEVTHFLHVNFASIGSLVIIEYQVSKVQALMQLLDAS